MDEQGSQSTASAPEKQFNEPSTTSEEPPIEEIKRTFIEDSIAFKATGNKLFGEGDFQAAIEDYTRAIDSCPEEPQHNRHRSVLLSNRAAAYIKLGIKENYEAAVTDCSAAVELDHDNVKALLRRAKLYELLENFDEALVDYKALAERDRSIPGVMEACLKLPQQIEERNEKMKTEMMGKLKDLGNLVLKPFGLSTENFKMEPQPSGGYSVKFEPKAAPKK